MSIVHNKVSAKPTPSDVTKVGGPDWNDQHLVSGTAVSNGSFTLSTGWGTGKAISNSRGYDDAHSFTVTSGTGPSANPTISYTFLDGTITNIPIIHISLIGGTGIAIGYTIAITNSAYTITITGTPQSSQTYIFNASFMRLR